MANFCGCHPQHWCSVTHTIIKCILYHLKRIWTGGDAVMRDDVLWGAIPGDPTKIEYWGLFFIITCAYVP